MFVKKFQCPNCETGRALLWLPDEEKTGGEGILMADPIVREGSTYFICHIRDRDILCRRTGLFGGLDAVFLTAGDRIMMNGEPGAIYLDIQMHCINCGTYWTECIPINLFYIWQSRLVMDYKKRKRQ